MQGLLVYKQYLENIRNNIHNYDLEELKSSKFLDILTRSQKIQDLSYLDAVFSHAGLDMSFFDSEDFLQIPVQVKSSILEFILDEDESYEDIDELNDSIVSTLDDEEAVIQKLNDLIDSLGVSSIHDEVDTSSMWSSKDDTTYLDALLETQKESLQEMFTGLSKISERMSKDNITDVRDLEKKIKEEQEEKEKEDKKSSVLVGSEDEDEEHVVDEDKDESIDVQDDSSEQDVEEIDMESDLEDEMYDDSAEYSNSDGVDESDVDLENVEDNKTYFEQYDSYSSKDYDKSSETSPFDNVASLGDNKSDDWYTDDILDEDVSFNESFEKKDVNIFADDIQDSTDDGLDLFSDKYDKDNNETSDTDEKGKSIFEADDEDKDLNSSNNMSDDFVDAVQTEVPQRKLTYAEEMKQMAKSEGRLNNSEYISDSGDAFAKLLLGLGGNILSVPEKIGGLFTKKKPQNMRQEQNNSVSGTVQRKHHSSFIVDDDDDENFY